MCIVQVLFRKTTKVEINSLKYFLSNDKKTTHSFWTFRKQITIIFENDCFIKTLSDHFYTIVFKKSVFWKKYFIKSLTFMKMIMQSSYMQFIECHLTGCPKKHGNSVTNWISSLLWISIVIPNFKSHHIIMSARVYFMKTGKDCKDMSIMSPQDKQWRRTGLLCFHTAIFLYY